MSAYTQVKDAIEALVPTGWKFTGYEPLEDMPDVTGLTLKVREVRRLPQAPIGHVSVDWILTITTSYTSRETADPTLFDDLIDFIVALDAEPDLSWLAWTSATKTVGDDLERLAYDITLQTHHQKEA